MTNKETFWKTSLAEGRAGGIWRFVLVFSKGSIYVCMEGKGGSREHAIKDKRGGLMEQHSPKDGEKGIHNIRTKY